MTRKRLSGRSGFTICHNDILPFVISNKSKSEEPDDFRGHASSGVRASGDEKVKTTRAAAVPQIGSLSFASIGSFSRLFKRTVLLYQC